MTFLRYFAFRERITPWFIGWVFEVVFGGRNTSSTVFKPSITVCAGELSTVRITFMIFFIKLFIEFLYPFIKEETLHPTFHLRSITTGKAFDVLKAS